MRGTDLQTHLMAFHDGMLERLSPADRAVIAAAEQALARSAVGQGALRPGDMAPAFCLVDQHGRAVRLVELLRQGPAVAVFFRGGWCPFCSLTLRAYQDALPAFRAAGASLLAITPEPPDGCRGNAERNALHFPLLFDRGNLVADAFGVTYEIQPELRALYKRLGHELPKLNATGDWRTPLPATFVIGPDRQITAAHVAPAVYRRMEPAEALAAVHAVAPQGVQLAAGN